MWICRNCTNFHFSDSFFECDSEPNIAVCDIDSSVQPNVDIFDQLRTARKTFPNRFLCAYLNINSLRYKFDYIKDLLTQNTVDLLFIAETKLDESFVNAQFMVDNYHLRRADRNQKGGGVAAFLRSDIAGGRRSDLEFRQTEGINVEVKLNGSKWLFIGAYKPPSMTGELFEADITIGLDKISEKYDNYVILGDLNFDMLEKSKGCKLEKVCDVFDLSNVIKGPTCFTSGNKPSLVDVILTNSTSYIGKTFNFGCGLSDVHNLIGVQLKLDVPLSKPRWRTYRSFRNFDVENFKCELNKRLV